MENLLLEFDLPGGHNQKLEKGVAQAQKARVKIYDTIMDALKHGYIGQIFSTRGAKRLYVITHKKWGQSNQQEFNGKVAKGFSPGSIPAGWKDVKKYAVRTMQRYGTDRSSKGREKAGRIKLK